MSVISSLKNLLSSGKIKDTIANIVEDNNKKLKNAEEKGEKLLGDMASQRDDYLDKTISQSSVSTDLDRIADKDMGLVARKYYEKEMEEQKKAAKSLYNSKISDANDSYNQKESNLSQKLISIGKELEKDIKNLKDKSLKNNVARSSIRQETQSDLENVAGQEQSNIDSELEQAKESLNKKIKNAEEQLNQSIYDIDYNYAVPIADKQNELQTLKDSNSTYKKSLVNVTARKEYDRNLMALVEQYINEVGPAYAQNVLEKQNYLSDYLSQEQIDEIRKKYSI